MSRSTRYKESKAWEYRRAHAKMFAYGKKPCQCTCVNCDEDINPKIARREAKQEIEDQIVDYSVGDDT